MKKLIALALILVLGLALIPAAHADSDPYAILDEVFGAVVEVWNEGLADNKTVEGGYSYIRRGNVVMVNVATNVIDESVLNAQKSSLYRASWKLTVSGSKVDEQRLREALENYIDGAALFFNIVSYNEPGTVYATILKGEVIYDCVEGVSILKPAE